MRAWIRGAALALCLASPLAAAAQSQAGMLYMHDLAFDPVKAPPKLAASLRAKAESGYALVQYEPDQGLAVYRALRAANIIIVGPVARDAFLVASATLKQLRAIKGVRFAGIFEPAYKLHPELRAAAERGAGDNTEIVVEVFRDPGGVAKAIGAFGKAWVVGKNQDRVVAKVPARSLARVAAIADVRSLEPSMFPMPSLDMQPQRIGVRTQSAPPNYRNLDGANQRVGVYDTGCDNGDTNTLIPDLVNRVDGDTNGWINNVITVPTWADLTYGATNNNHGTSVADVIVGNGARSTNQRLTGIAYAARALMRPFNADTTNLTPNFLDLNVALTNAYAWGARVHNDSWDPATGTWPNPILPRINQYLMQTSAVIDQFTYTNWDLLIVVAAGNQGPGANTIGANGCSKNSLVVGNSGNGNPPTGAVNPDAGVAYDGRLPNQLALDTARGTAPGGRLKPEVVAPGDMVAMTCTQAMLNSGACPDLPYAGEPYYNYDAGTSFSSPAVAGEALLVRQLLNTVTLLPNPSGMLLKALIVNGAQQVTVNPTPDNLQGWGIVNLPRTVDGPGGDTYYYDSVNQHGVAFRFTQAGQQVVFSNITFAQHIPLSITLTWYDPAPAVASGTLINDLDLTLTTQDGTVYHGGVNAMAGGWTQPGNTPDTVNNTLKLMLQQTPINPATVTISSTRISATQPQAFAVVISSIASVGAGPFAQQAPDAKVIRAGLGRLLGAKVQKKR